MSDLKLGFIGLGRMGMPMAQNLLKAGFVVTVWGRTPSRLQPAVDCGAKIAASPRELAVNSDLIALCVTDTSSVESVVFGTEGIEAGGSADKTLIDFSTIHPDGAKRFGTRLRESCGMGWVDAPVSGGPSGAEAGTLAIMAGGDTADIDAVRPIMSAISGLFTHMGPAGAGLVTKLCNQMIINASIAGIAEGLTLAANYGIDANTLPDALTGGWADSPLLQSHARRMAKGGDEKPMGGMWLKDMDLACDVGRHTKTPLPVTSLVTEMCRMSRERTGDGTQIGIMRLYADRAL